MIRGYKRRRGWLAYHVGLLPKLDPKNLPSLAELTGEHRAAGPDPAAPQSETMMAHNLRLWRAVLNKGN